MCGIIGVVARTPVNQLLYDGLLVMQHRGQDAAGIVTADGTNFHSHRGMGMVRDVFRTRNMRALSGYAGIAHTRYPTAGSPSSAAESQPFYVNSPFGIVLAHNGNLTNTEQLKIDLFRTDLRHVNTTSDSEVLLNVLAHELQEAATNYKLEPATIFAAVSGVHQRCRGAYAIVAMIAGYGLLAFRDPYGIRPLIFGRLETDKGFEYMVASESVALDAMGYEVVRDVAPGEAIFIDMDGNFYSRQCAPVSSLNPCIFEFVYLARPDSVIDGISVYETRLRMGESLADKISRKYQHLDIDVVIPVPDSSRPAAMELSKRLNLPYREGFIKNRYIGRTFIMPGQAVRRKSVRQKLNAISMEFKGKNVLIVDDSIVRGTTSSEIVQMARDAGARKVYFASAAPPVRFANVYGIDMPTRDELIASNRSDDEIACEIGCDELIYQDLDALIEDVKSVNPRVKSFEASCFNGEYITGDVTREYLDGVEQQRRSGAELADSVAAATQLDLDLELVD
jgi:amidophosphoribosyltransferase